MVSGREPRRTGSAPAGRGDVGLYRDILSILRDLRFEHGYGAVLDPERLSGMLADELGGRKRGECRILLCVLEEDLPRRMLDGEASAGVMRAWALRLANAFFFRKHAVHAAILCWHDLLLEDDGEEEELRLKPVRPGMYADILLALRRLRSEHGERALFDYGRLDGMLSEAMGGRKEEERRLLLRMLDEILPQQMHSGTMSDGALLRWAYYVADRDRIREEDALAALLCWRDLFLADAEEVRERRLEAVRRHAKEIVFIPARFRDREICLEAARRDARALLFVPGRLQDDVRADAEVQCRLGLQHADGVGVRKDSAEAAMWFRRAAEQGHADARFALASCCANGLGVAKDDGEAVRWCRMAADQGNAFARYVMGWRHEFGLGVAADMAEAVRWYRGAAENGCGRAEKALERLDRRGGATMDGSCRIPDSPDTGSTLPDGPADGDPTAMTGTLFEEWKRAWCAQRLAEDEARAYAEDFARGRREEKLKIAIRCLKANLAADLISRCTGLSMEKVRELAAGLKRD